MTDPLYKFLKHLSLTNSSDRKYEAYRHRNGVRIKMQYVPSGVYDVVTALADNYKKGINFTATVQMVVGPDNPPEIVITILPAGASWVFGVIQEGKVVCDITTLVAHYEMHVDPPKSRKEVLKRIE